MTLPNGVVRRGLALAALFILGLDVALPAAAHAADAASVGAVVVRFRGEAIPRDATALPPAFADELAKAMRVGVVERGRTRDGAFRLSLEPPLPFVEARDAINRVRLRDDILYASLAPARDPAALPRVQPKSGTPEPLLHRLIVKYRDPGLEQAAALNLPLGQNQLDRIAALAGQPVAHERVMSGDAYVVRLFNRVSREEVEAIADMLALDPSVDWAQPDYLDQIALAPNDPSYASQWHYFEAAGGVNLPAAWNRTTGSASIRVAVIDTGSLPNHPDLSGKFVGGYDMISAFPIPGNDGDARDADPSDPGDWVAAGECGTGTSARNSSWHGTHVAGTIAALTNNGVGVAGINWASPIVPIRVLGKCGGYSSDIADGITWASGGTVTGVPANPLPARVLNLSLGGRRSNQTCDAVYQTAINDALSRNVVVVVAAGNANEEASFHAPGNCPGVITVAATGRNGQRASYSNYDNNDATGVQVEIAAPGGSDGAGVLSTLNSSATTPDPLGYNYVNYQGTSMATPHVAGIVSLMFSVAPTRTPAQILAAIQTTARAFPTGTIRDCTANLASVTTSIKYCGAGIIDADAAIAAVSSLPATTTTLASSANPSTSGSRSRSRRLGHRHRADRQRRVHRQRRRNRRLRRGGAHRRGQHAHRAVRDGRPRDRRPLDRGNLRRQRRQRRVDERTAVADGQQGDVDDRTRELDEPVDRRHVGHVHRHGHGHHAHRHGRIHGQRCRGQRLHRGRSHRRGQHPHRPVPDHRTARRQPQHRRDVRRRHQQQRLDIVDACTDREQGRVDHGHRKFGQSVRGRRVGDIHRERRRRRTDRYGQLHRRRRDDRGLRHRRARGRGQHPHRRSARRRRLPPACAASL